MSFEPWFGRRMSTAWQAILDMTADRAWHDRDELTGKAAAVGRIKLESAKAFIAQAVTAGALRARWEHCGTVHEHLIKLDDHCPAGWLRRGLQ